MNRELLQQALAALENSINAVEYEYQHYVEMFGKYTMRAAQIKCLGDDLDKHKAAIEALRAELAKPEPVAWLSTDCTGERYMCFTKPTELYPPYTKGTP